MKPVVARRRPSRWSGVIAWLRPIVQQSSPTQQGLFKVRRCKREGAPRLECGCSTTDSSAGALWARIPRSRRWRSTRRSSPSTARRGGGSTRCWRCCARRGARRRSPTGASTPAAPGGGGSAAPRAAPRASRRAAGSARASRSGRSRRRWGAGRSRRRAAAPPPRGRWADIATQTVLLLTGVALAHAFVDGNKRTALIVGDTSLDRNGWVFTDDYLELAERIEAW
jgi:hypothetical protein